MDYQNSQLWVIGDSFTSNKKYYIDGENYNWPSILSDRFNGNNKFLNSTNCKDMQTIMDLFYKNMHTISDNSLIIMFLPSLARIRYPRKLDYINNDLDNGSNYIENIDNIPYNFKDLFIHWPYEDYPNGTAYHELEFPFDTFDYSFNHGPHNHHIGLYYYEQRELWEDYVLGKVENFDFAKLINANSSTIQNWNDILYSIKKTFKFDIEFFSWSDELDPNIVWTKQKIKEEIGWHTMDDDWNDTNGESGYQYDEHFSYKMHKAFSDMIIKKYPNHFKS
jgi:hypothetical protein